MAKKIKFYSDMEKADILNNNDKLMISDVSDSDKVKYIDASQIKELIDSEENFEEKLVNNLKTINGNSLVGQGNIIIESGDLNIEEFIDGYFDSTNHILISNEDTPYIKIKLSTQNTNYSLDINNITEGSVGKILITQGGYSTLELGSNFKGELKLPTKPDTLVLVTYNYINGEVIFTMSTIIGDADSISMETIDDLSVVYYDSKSAQIKWTAPYGNTATDKVTGYDIRYSNHLLDADVDANWIGMKKINAPTPSNPGIEENLTIIDLPGDQEYYVYIKSYQLIYGIRYTSKASNFGYFRTIGNTEISNKPYRITVLPECIYTQVNKTIKQTNGEPAVQFNMVDEEDKLTFKNDGYPDLTNKNFTTYWQTYSYGRNTAYYRVIIDLLHPYVMDKIFIYGAGLGQFSIFSIPDLGGTPVKIAESTKRGNNWSEVNLNKSRCRFLIFQHDLQMFCGASTSPTIEPNEYGVPNPYYNWDLGQIGQMVLYGSSVLNIPDGIKPVYKNSTNKRTMNDWLCVNGHAYQSGRLHSFLSGPNVRLYMHPGQMASFNNANNMVWPATIEDTKFRLNRIPWIMQNGPGYGWRELLEKTYKPYNLKPIITATGVLDFVRLIWNNTSYNYGNQCDGNVYSGYPKPLPKNSVNGLDEYLDITGNANNYKVYSKLAYALASVYGKNKDLENNPSSYIWSPSDYPTPEPMDTGLDLLGGFEPDNEMDKGWQGMMGYLLPEMVSALQSAVKDSNLGSINTIMNSSTYGAHTIDPDFKIMHGGLANNSAGYVLYMILSSLNKRSDYSVPTDAINMHLYFSNLWLDDDNAQDVQYTYAVSPEVTFDKKYFTGKTLDQIIKLRNYFVPNKELWMTEFGYGEAGARNSKSQYQCYSLPGKIINGVTFKDRHRSDVKGSYIIRAILTLLDKGFNQGNMYITFNDDSWWGNGGGGNEMFRWDEFTNETVGAKYNAIQQYESVDSKSGFSAFGFFGSNMWNGGYPISRSFWYIALFRTVLGNFEYIGKLKHPDDEKIVIACFRERNGTKGAYAVYYNDTNNNGIVNVDIPVPDGNSNVNIHQEYIPIIPDPNNVPARLGADQHRTGIPTSRREKYINGQWVIQNRYFANAYESYSNAPAQYPSNPQEGDVVTTLPTIEENPYFPIVGPVGAKAYGNLSSVLPANQYEVQEQEGTDLVWRIRYNTVDLSWRQCDAIADYIEFHPEGIKGRNGVVDEKNVINNFVRINVSEFPQYIVFEGVPETSYESHVDNLSAKAINSNSIKLFWNNNNAEDTGYEIFISSLPETGYTLHSTTDFGENNVIIKGLESNTTYYFKIRPIKNEAKGDFSDFISVKPFSFIPDITNLRVTSRSTSTISIKWDYTDESLSDFYGYGIYRESGNGIFNLVTIVSDKNDKKYTDTNLLVGHPYTYKLKALGLNGQSNYTPELQTRTLLETESSPIIQSAETDKLGTTIKVYFNIPLNPPTLDALQAFKLTENGEIRNIRNIRINDDNKSVLMLEIPSDTLLDYTNNTILKLTYNPTEDNYITSEYMVKVEGFTDFRVINKIGNFTNLLGYYKINLAPTGSIIPTTTDYWNHLIGNAEGSEVKLTSLTDNYGISHPINVYNYYSNSVKSWGAGGSSGMYSGTDVPIEIYQTAWNTAYGSANDEKLTAKLNFSNLTVGNMFKIVAYGSRRNSTTFLKIKANNKYSPTLAELNNVDKFIELDELKSDSLGNLTVEFITDLLPTDPKNSANINFIYLYEYLNNDISPNTYVYLREVSINEDVDKIGVVTTPDISITYNAIGNGLQYRISEDPTFSDVTWLDLTDGNILPYTINTGYGNKTLHIQLKNNVAESNIKIINFEYKDPYVDLQLNSIFINNDDTLTYNKNVYINVNKLGIPTHYRISSSSEELLVSEWVEYPIGQNFAIPYILSDGNGIKTLFVQLKDNKTESVIKSDSIEYQEITYLDVELTIKGNVSQSFNSKFAPLKYNKFFAYSITSDDGHVSGWNVLFKYFNGMWMDDLQYYHILRSRTTGSYAPRALTYTDGAGVIRRFPIDCTIDPNPAGPINPDNNGGDQFPYLLYNEYREILEFDGAVSYHDVKDPNSTSYGGTVEQIYNGLVYYSGAIKNKLGVLPAVLTEPNGDAKYTTAGMMFNPVKMIITGRGDSTFTAINLHNSNIDLNKLKLARYFREAVGSNGAQGGANIWINDFETNGYSRNGTYGAFGLHGSDRNSSKTVKDWPSFEIFINYLYNTYGKDGLDNMWMCTNQEVVEYKHQTKYSIITTEEKTNNQVKLKIKFPVFPDFKWSEISILCDGLTNVTDVISSNNVIGLSHAVNGSSYLINVNLDNTLITRSEKYTAKYESSLNLDDLASAKYFIQRLKPELQIAFNNRLADLTAKPDLTSFVINKQRTEGLNDVTTSITFTSNDKETQYMISESPTFVNATWVNAIGKTIPFVVSNTLGEHTIYFKLKNNFGESQVVSNSVIYYGPDIKISNFILNNGNPTTERLINYDFNVVGFPKNYMISENSDFSDASWLNYSDIIKQFELSSSFGIKNVYIALKNEIDTIYANNSITYVDASGIVLNSFSINNGNTYSISNIFNLTLNTNRSFTKYRVSENPDNISSLPWVVGSSNTITYTSVKTIGLVTLYVQVANDTSESNILNNSITVINEAVLNSIIINNGDSSTFNKTVNINILTSGDVTHYAIGESVENLTNWINFNSNVSYTFNSIGNKTLYVKVKNQVNESVIKSNTILIENEPTKMLIGFNGVSSNTNTKIVTNNLTTNQINLNFHTSYTPQQLVDTSNNNVTGCFLNINSSFYLANNIFGGIFNGNPSGINATVASGIYSLETMTKCMTANGTYSEANKRRFRASFTLAIGTYNIKILWNTSNTNYTITNDTTKNQTFYGAFQGNTLLAETVCSTVSGFTALNNQDFNASFQITVNDNTIPVDIAGWSTSLNNRPGVNLIQITKLS